MANGDLCRMRIVSEEYRDFIVGKGRDPVFDNIAPDQQCTQGAGFGYACIYVERSTADPINLERYSYNAIPNCYTLLDMEMLNQAGISQIQNYPTLQLKGEGIMIGFVDTGIDYENPVFRNLDGSTRIEEIWDQSIQTGETPEDFLYGSVYGRERIDEALRSENPLEIVPSQDTSGHGTFLASIAAGGANVENQFLGAAPESTIAVVKLKEAKQYLKDYYFIARDAQCYQETDIMLAVRYLDRLAKSRNMPLVLCIALGTNMGGHNSTTPLASILEMYSNMVKRAVVVGVGNEANQRHHYMGTLTNMSDRREVEIQVNNEPLGFVLELWTETPNIISVSLISPSGEQIPRIPIRQKSSELYQFVFERTEVQIDYRLLVERTNSELVMFRFARPANGIWKIVVEPVQIADGIFHMWLPVREFLTGEVYFLQSNPNYTITSPGNAIAPITVAYYNGADNSIDINSGRGYTRNERIKPDFAAPGVDVLGAALRGQFVRRTGSSIAVGVTAGAAALLLEWIVYQLGGEGIDTIQIKSLLILGTVRDPLNTYPNREWGYGRMNLYRTFDEVRRY